MKIGKMRNVLVIERNTGSGIDDVGAITPDWTALATVRARMMPKTGLSLWEGSQAHGIVNEIFEMRYTDVQFNDRITKDGTRIFHVVWVDIPNDKRDNIFVYVKEEDSNG